MPSPELKRLANLMRMRREKEPPYLLVLGAGASLSSGCSSGADVIKDIVDKYSTKPNKPALDWDQKTEECYNILDSMSEEERYLILEKHLVGRAPSSGYYALAALVQAGFFDIVLSTNCDVFLEDALTDVGMRSRDFDVLIFGREKDEKIREAVRFREPRVKILKVHGDLRARIFAFTPKEIFDFGKNLQPVIEDLLSRSLVIVGHSMRDADINRALRADVTPIHYVNPAAPTPSDFIWQAMQVRKGFAISGEDGKFDEFFTSLAGELGVRTTIGTTKGTGDREAVPAVDPRLVRLAVQVLGLGENPFGAEQAERDRRLRNFRIEVPALDAARGARHSLVFGAPGSGKTAAVFLLEYDCEYPPASPYESSVFPIHHNPALDAPPDSKRNIELESLGRSLALALLRVFLRTTSAFLEHKEENKLAIAYLLARYIDEDELTILFRQIDLAAAGTELMSQRSVLSRKARSMTERDEKALLDLLGQARPAGLSYTYVLVDLEEPTDTITAAQIATRLQPLLYQAVHLDQLGVYLKLFLPDTLHPFLSLESFSPVFLTWTEQDLTRLLNRRLAMVGCPSLLALCGPDVCGEPSPDTRLVRAANGSPRKLIQLGNKLLERVGKHPELGRITADDLDAVLGLVANEVIS